MAICKMCHRMIPDGRDFCDECESKSLNQADESYLDHLLSSVSSIDDNSQDSPDVWAKFRHEERPDEADSLIDSSISEDSFSGDVVDDLVSDIFANSSHSEPNAEELTEDFTEEVFTYEETEISAEPEEELTAEPESPIEDVFATLEPEEELTAEPVSDDIITDELSTEEQPVDIEPEAMMEDIVSQPETDVISDIQGEDIPTDIPVDDTAEESPVELLMDDNLMEDITADAVMDAMEPELSKDEEIDSMINDLLSEMPDEPLVEEAELDSADIADIFSAAEDESPIETFVNPGEELDEKGMLGTDELFALDDATIPEQDLVDIGVPDEGAPEDIDVLEEIENGSLEKKIKSLDGSKSKKAKPEKKKKSWFQRLFGNVVEELTDEEREARKAKAEADEQKKAEALELKKKKDEESKAQKAAQKELDKAENAEKKKQADEAKRKAKEEAREKAKKKKEAKEALELSQEQDEGRINKAGASILFILFTVITLFIIIGTKSYSYNLSIENARDDFEIRHYNEAYYDVYGLDIKDEDIELYDRIMTVMYVNTQLNSYQYYMTSNNTEKALDSLLKGLSKYEKYLNLATQLQIEDDLKYVRGNILNELNTKFGISEEEAYSMIDINDVVDYSEYIYALLGTYELEDNQ